MPLIVFTSQPQFLVVPADALFHKAEVDGFQIAENAEPVVEERLPENTRRYWLEINAEVQSLDELWKRREKIYDFIEDLERVWPYAAGLPLRPIHTELQVVYAPDGWTSNVEAVEHQIRIEQHELTGTISFSSRHWLEASRPPLRSACDALASFRKASSVIRSLIDLHLNALTSTGDSRLVLFANALELVRDLLPGKDQHKRGDALQPEIRAELSRSFSWLFGMANNRFNIRHVVRNPTGPTLHPPMTREERRDFEHDADLVIRGVIVQHLGIDLSIVRTP